MCVSQKQGRTRLQLLCVCNELARRQCVCWCQMAEFITSQHHHHTHTHTHTYISKVCWCLKNTCLFSCLSEHCHIPAEDLLTCPSDKPSDLPLRSALTVLCKLVGTAASPECWHGHVPAARSWLTPLALPHNKKVLS